MTAWNTSSSAAVPRLRSLAVGLVVMCCRAVSASGAGAPDWAVTARVMPGDRALAVSGSVRIPAGIFRNELTFALSAQMRDLRVEIVEPIASAGQVSVTRIERTSGGRVEGERLHARWILRSSQPIPETEPVRLRFTYFGSGDKGLIYAITPEVAFASGWGDAWMPVLDELSGEATGDLTVITPSGWTAVTGTPCVSRPDEQGQGVFRFEYAQPTYFTFVAAPFTVVRRAGPVPVAAYLSKPREHTEAYLAGAQKMITALSREFGPFPFDELKLVEVPRPLAKEAGFNAFSPAGMVVLNSRSFDFPVENQLEWLGHEMGHQWFPHAVSWDPPGFLYQEEAMAEYGGLRVVEALAGPEAARRTRIQGFEHDPIYSASAYFRQLGAGEDKPLAKLQSAFEDRNLAYNKGSLVFYMLSRELGLEVFQRILAETTRGRHFHVITWKEFLETVDRVSGRKLDWFFEQWLERAGAPDFQLTWRPRGTSVDGAITQGVPYYRAKLKIRVRGRHGEDREHLVEITDADAAFTVDAGFEATEVILDPDYEVLRWTPEFKTLVEGLRAEGAQPK